MNRCLICGAECLQKYCRTCAKKAYSQRRLLREKGAKRRVVFKGCDEDCFNCTYPDCLKPCQEMKVDKELRAALAIGK